MKYSAKTALLFVSVMMLVLICGCEQLRLVNGKYETTLAGREDFAAVYEDLIFLRLRDPQSDGTGNYWDWAGKYKIDDDGRITLQMDKEKLRIWNFYYNFYSKRGAIAVADLSAESGFDLKFRPVGKTSAAPAASYGAYR